MTKLWPFRRRGPQDEPATAPPPEIVEGIEAALAGTKKTFFRRIADLLGRPSLDSQVLGEVEELLVGADVGVATTERILEGMGRRLAEGDARDYRDALAKELLALLPTDGAGLLWGGNTPPEPPRPAVILMVGVNGTGKTTSIAKLAHSFRSQGQRVLLAAADTFRAAAIDQLELWGDRVGAPVIAHKPGADPGAVVYDALAAARAREVDVVIIDTAGRLHTKFNLMEELRKVHRVIQRQDTTAPHEVLLVMDATTGQNGLYQARAFTEAVGVTGIFLAKLDGTAKGGIVFAIGAELRLPVRFIGTGEGLADIAPFGPQEFVEALLS